mgnify:CR=1 FL=1
MRKIIAFLLAALLSLSAACAEATPTPAAEDFFAFLTEELASYSVTPAGEVCFTTDQSAYIAGMPSNTLTFSMSRGQYELVRASAQDKRSQTGLELNVRDYVNDTERPVASLSGGEAFLASLSLALGMSDEIQAQEGGIELDVLFVDEGFGSLDEELLRIAIGTLQSLSENRRLVGVISHVQELRERIGRKIIVRKGEDGASQARIEA